MLIVETEATVDLLELNECSTNKSTTGQYYRTFSVKVKKIKNQNRAGYLGTSGEKTMYPVVAALQIAKPHANTNVKRQTRQLRE